MHPGDPDGQLPDPFRDPARRPPLSLDDAPLPYELLARLCPAGARWPDWRTLLQDQVWIIASGENRRLAECSRAELSELLAWLHGQVDRLHEQAAVDEAQATSSALAWAFRQAGIAPVADLDPVAWLESTALVRTLRRRLASGDWP